MERWLCAVRIEAVPPWASASIALARTLFNRTYWFAWCIVPSLFVMTPISLKRINGSKVVRSDGKSEMTTIANTIGQNNTINWKPAPGQMTLKGANGTNWTAKRFPFSFGGLIYKYFCTSGIDFWHSRDFFLAKYSDFFLKSILKTSRKYYFPECGLLIGVELKSAKAAFDAAFLGANTGASYSFTEELTEPVSKTVTNIFEKTQNKLLVKFLYRMELLYVRVVQ